MRLGHRLAICIVPLAMLTSSAMSQAPPPETFTAFIQSSPAATTLNGSEPVPIIQGGKTVQTTTRNISNLTVLLPGITVALRSTSSPAVSASATTDYFLCLDPTANAIQVNLPPSPALGLTFLVKDCTGQAQTHNITIVPTGANIDGIPNFIINLAFQSVAVTYNGVQWSIN